MNIYEDERTVVRSDLAAWLRQLADQLDSEGQVYYGAGGRLTVADEVKCELEIERENDSEMSLEIEFSWSSPEQGNGARAAADQGDEDAEETEEPQDRDDSEENEEPEEEGEPQESAAADEGRDRRRVPKRGRPAPRRSPVRAGRS
jgi:amphi-Trp domain-containing protein